MNIKKGKYYRFDGPNGFTVKALDNSYDATFRAVVVLQGVYSHEVGHISSAWSNTSFIESDLSEFLEEANKRYPMGSRYVCLGGDPEGVNGHGVSSVEYEAKIWYYNDELRGIDMGNYVVYNFCIDKWAEIINDQVDIEETLIEAEFDLTTDEGRLAYAKKYYPIGTKYIPLDSYGNSYNNRYISQYDAKFWGGGSSIEVGSGLIYHNGRCAEIIKEEESRVSVFAENDLFNMDTDEGRLAYARKYYPIGTKFKPILPIVVSGQTYDSIITSEYKPRIWVSDRGCNNGIEVSKIGLIYYERTNKWAEIIKEETIMETQKISRKGLKEIHSVAFGYWQATLELFGTRNPFEDYVELTQKEVDDMFNSCNKEQLPIISKYLKQDDGSVDVTNVSINIRVGGEYENKAFALHEDYNWEIKKDSFGFVCLIPTKKK